jgi:hypothetical protein
MRVGNVEEYENVEITPDAASACRGGTRLSCMRRRGGGSAARVSAAQPLGR